MRHLAYAVALAVCLAATLPLVGALRLARVRRTGAVLVTIASAAAPFLVWDLLATRARQWHFDPAQVLGLRVLGLPIEEYAFFVVIPLAGIVTYEGVGAVLGRRG